MERPTKSRIAVSDPLAPVRVSPVRVNGSSVTNKGIEILNDDGSWEAINIHSASYNLISNSEVDRTTREILNASEIGWKPTNEVWTGRYWAKLYKSDLSVEVPMVGDTLSLGLRIENSYDASCQFRLVLMAYILSCANGLVSPKYFTSYKMRHTISNEFITSEAVSVLRSGMDEVMEIVPLVERLNKIPLSIELISKVSKETPLANGEWGFIIKELTGARSAWDLMQVITNRLTHHGRGKSSLLNQEKIGDYFLDSLIRYAS